MTATEVIRLIDPAVIEPRNRAYDLNKLMGLQASFRQSGWCGIPIYIEVAPPGSAFEWKAVTGSHRITAAISAGLPFIPCRLYDRATDSLESEGPE